MDHTWRSIFLKAAAESATRLYTAHRYPRNVADLEAFISCLPKVELHVHHVGSASPRIVSDLALRHEGTTSVPSDPEALERFFEFRDFDHFIEVYLAVVDLIREPQDLWLLVYEVGRELARQCVRYAEVTITPYSHVVRGMAAGAMCEAIEDARVAAQRDHGVVMRWCFDIPGESGIQAAEETLRVALDHRPDGLISFGLGGPEVGVPRRQFQPFFDAARAAGLKSVPHAGETTGPDTIWDAINFLGAERIGHGISAVDDDSLLELLGEQQIPLEICPTSNVRTRAVAAIEAHPLPELVGHGLHVTINSDDPPMFGTTLEAEYLLAARMLGLDETGIAEISKAGVEAAFLDAGDKRRLIREIDDYLG